MTSPVSIALWGGFECSLTRIGDVWRDQLSETGHFRRQHDIAEAAALGIRALRTAFHWERYATNDDQWPRARAQLDALRAQGLGVIAGLMHHGSAPAGLDLLHPDMPARLAQHAAKVGRLCPDAIAWTPVNEPLTTARFACLYGFWHPHHADTAAFLRAVANQCRATLLAMRAIRAVVPSALLLQTEDITRTFATLHLAAQARYENLRRWLSLDLLTGRVTTAHPFRASLLTAGVPTIHLDELATGEARPDIIGANFYVTSERFLDHRTALYPRHLHGGNGRQTYADTEAVRAAPNDFALGWIPRLREVWRRYRIPIVISEAQLGCADEAEQARWFRDAWDAAHQLQAEGVDIRAVTAWALVGAVDWNSLMRHQAGHFEAGAWQPGDAYRKRLLAHCLAACAQSKRFDHPAIDAAGWWHRDDRILPALARA